MSARGRCDAASATPRRTAGARPRPCPTCGASSPATSRSSVDFPHPDGPRIARNCPGGTSSEMPSSATTPVSNVRRTSRTMTRVPQRHRSFARQSAASRASGRNLGGRWRRNQFRPRMARMNTNRKERPALPPIRCSFVANGFFGLRLQHDLDAPVLLLVEHLVAVRGLAQRQLVGDDEAGVDVAVLDVVDRARGTYLCTWVWPILKVRPFCMAAPNGNLSRTPP